MGRQLRDALKAAGFSAPQKPGRMPVLRTDARGSPAPVASRTDAVEILRKTASASASAVTPEKGDETLRQPLTDASVREKAASISAVVQPKQPAILRRIGRFAPHALFLECDDLLSAADGREREGIRRDIADTPDNETDLIIGLDFGTSSTKAVIRDEWGKLGAMPVPLNPNAKGTEAFLLPSRVHRSDAGWSLQAEGKAVADLKLGLLGATAGDRAAAFDDCCAYLSLVIRRCRGWLYLARRADYANHRLNWKVNMGLPARSYEDEDTVLLFRRLIWASANLAADRSAVTITSSAVLKWRSVAESIDFAGDSASFPEAEFGSEHVDVVPEVAAQLHGFMRATRWDWLARPVMMLVDVGAGTVDAAIFHVRMPATGDGILTFWGCRVERNGVMELHRERVRSLRARLPDGAEHSEAAAYLDGLIRPTDRLRPIPESILDYLGGYDASCCEETDESFFVARYRRQTVGCISEVKVRKQPKPGQLFGIPLLLCGGGARMRFYSRVEGEINSTEGWKSTVKVERTVMRVPADLAQAGWSANDYDRLSVAYGLCSRGANGASLGRIVRAFEVPDVISTDSNDFRGDGFISKDAV